MASDLASQLTPSGIADAHAKIAPYIHRTPLITNHSLNVIASSPNPRAFLSDNPPPSTTNSPTTSNTPQFNLHFKCENQQKIGAFKARGAHHALIRLIEHLGHPALQQRGVITHSSGNHAQALALAAKTFGIPSYIVMPSISTPSKIAGTRMYADQVIFSGSTSVEREAVVADVQRTIAERNGGEGAILVPPYDAVDIVLGQGTAAREMEEQFGQGRFDAVLTPLGGGGMLSGTATWFSHTNDGGKKTLVFGAEPSFEGANDGEMGLARGKRIEHVQTLTIADGLRTPLGEIPWFVISDKTKLEGIFSVSEDEIKMALRLLMERAKVFAEPSSAVPLAVVLFNERFRAKIAELQRLERERTGVERAWDVGIMLTGGNTTLAALAKLFSDDKTEDGKPEERHAGLVGFDGKRKAEDVAG